MINSITQHDVNKKNAKECGKIPFFVKKKELHDTVSRKTSIRIPCSISVQRCYPINLNDSRYYSCRTEHGDTGKNYIEHRHRGDLDVDQVAQALASKIELSSAYVDIHLNKAPCLHDARAVLCPVAVLGFGRRMGAASKSAAAELGRQPVPADPKILNANVQ